MRTRRVHTSHVRTLLSAAVGGPGHLHRSIFGAQHRSDTAATRVVRDEASRRCPT